VKLIKRTFIEIARRKGDRGSPHTSVRSGFVTYTPMKDVFNLNTVPIESSYPLQLFGNQLQPDMGPPPPQLTRSDSNPSVPMLSDAARPGSSRPGSKRSLMKKVHVEDILAMRRMEQGVNESDRMYPGIQPMRLTVSPTLEKRDGWPTYRFGEKLEEWNP
jgi:hypothetical protein